MRRKSSLKGTRVKKDPAFAHTMRNAGILGKASAIASGVYRKLTPAAKTKGLYRKMTGEAMQLLRAGTSAAEVILQLQNMYLKAAPQPSVVRAKVLTHRVFAAILPDPIFTEWLPDLSYADVIAYNHAPP